MITVTYSCGCKRIGGVASPAGLCPTHNAPPARLEVDRPEGAGRPSFKDWKAMRELRVECGLPADEPDPYATFGVSMEQPDPTLGTIILPIYEEP